MLFRSVWQAQQLSQMGALTKRVIDLMADFDGISPSEIETILKKDGYEILDEVSQELKYSDQKSQPISNESFNMLDSMVRQTTDTLNNTINQTLLSRNYGVNPVMRTYQEILKQDGYEILDEVSQELKYSGQVSQPIRDRKSTRLNSSHQR